MTSSRRLSCRPLSQPLWRRRSRTSKKRTLKGPHLMRTHTLPERTLIARGSLPSACCRLWLESPVMSLSRRPRCGLASSRLLWWRRREECAGSKQTLAPAARVTSPMRSSLMPWFEACSGFWCSSAVQLVTGRNGLGALNEIHPMLAVYNGTYQQCSAQCRCGRSAKVQTANL
jgi:hypothetical protein